MNLSEITGTGVPELLSRSPFFQRSHWGLALVDPTKTEDAPRRLSKLLDFLKSPSSFISGSGGGPLGFQSPFRNRASVKKILSSTCWQV